MEATQAAIQEASTDDFLNEHVTKLLDQRVALVNETNPKANMWKF